MKEIKNLTDSPTIDEIFYRGEYTEDQEIVKMGENGEVSVWIRKESSKCYLVNNSENDIYLNITRMVGESEVDIIPKNGGYDLDSFGFEPAKNNQQLMITNCSITTKTDDAIQLISFDYNNNCVYNALVSLNQILMSILVREVNGKKIPK